MCGDAWSLSCARFISTSSEVGLDVAAYNEARLVPYTHFVRSGYTTNCAGGIRGLLTVRSGSHPAAKYGPSGHQSIAEIFPVPRATSPRSARPFDAGNS